MERSKSLFLQFKTVSMSGLKALVESYARYNLWANNVVVDMLTTITEEEFKYPNQSSFGSIGATLWHIYGAEKLWMNRLAGNSLSSFPKYRPLPPIEILNSFIDNSDKFTQQILGYKESQLTESIAYTTLSTGAGSNNRADICLHTINHSTFHRGQIISMLRNLGYRDFEPLDYIYFIRSIEND